MRPRLVKVFFTDRELQQKELEDSVHVVTHWFIRLPRSSSTKQVMHSVVSGGHSGVKLNFIGHCSDVLLAVLKLPHASAMSDALRVNRYPL